MGSWFHCNGLMKATTLNSSPRSLDKVKANMSRVQRTERGGREQRKIVSREEKREAMRWREEKAQKMMHAQRRDGMIHLTQVVMTCYSNVVGSIPQSYKFSMFKTLQDIKYVYFDPLLMRLVKQLVQLYRESVLCLTQEVF